LETKIPTIWAAVVDEDYKGKVKCYNAAGAHINPEKALEGALVEVITSIFVYNNILESGMNIERTKGLEGAPDKVLDMEDHVYFYANEKNFTYIQEFYENDMVLDFKQAFASWYLRREENYTFKEIMYKVSEHHKEIYISYLHTEINKELGLKCVKVVIPSMLTMTFGNTNKRINYERVQKGLVVAGKKKWPTKADLIYDVPHPFP
jgi:ribosomal protein S12 methylthiotransferase accessory factor